MNKYMKRWTAMILAACLLLMAGPAALMEGEPAAGAFDVEAVAAAEATEAPAEAPTEPEAEAEPEVAIEAEGEPEAAIEAEPAEAVEIAPVEAEASAEEAELTDAGDIVAPAEDDAPEADAEAPLILEEGSEKPYAYAWTVNKQNVVYRDDELTDPIYTLKAGEAVLVVERAEHGVRAAINTAQGVVEGYMAPSDVGEMCDSERDYLMNLLAAIGDVALYEDDIDWPLAPEANRQNLGAADFTRQSNDKEFVVQGKTITARMVGDHSDCWSWANALYKIIWGVKFTNKFIGDPVTGHSLIRNLSDEERLLTGANLKRFMKQSVPGCTLRIASCPSNCSNINIDSCPKHEKHSLIVVEIGEDGFVVMDNVTGNGTDRYDTRYYTYDNFAKHWAKYKMVKYIKWPNAPEFDRSRDSGVKPESVTLSETGIFIRAEDSKALTATVLPENAEDKSVTWSSSDPFIAYMDNSGSLVAVSSGTTTITATAANGVNTSTEVTVVPRDLKPKGVSLDQKGTVYVQLGSTLQLNATLNPVYANPDMKWKSSKKKVATVSATGLVTPKKAGTTTITVKTANKKTAKVKVKVLKGDAVGKVTLDQKGTVKLNMGETLKLNATLSPATAKTALKWKSSKKKIATVSSDGTVTPVKAGTTTIAVVTSNKKVAKVKVKVLDPNAPDKVTLDQTGTVKLSLGDTLKLTPSLYPETAQTSYTWKSSKKKIATVSADGTVTPKKKGATTIAVKTANGKVAKVKVKVVAAGKATASAEATGDASGSDAPTAVALDQTGTVKLKVGETLQLSAALTPETAQTTYTWKTSDKKVARVDANGLVQGVKAGTCTVGVVTANKKTAKVKIKVVK